MFHVQFCVFIHWSLQTEISTWCVIQAKETHDVIAGLSVRVFLSSKHNWRTRVPLYLVCVCGCACVYDWQPGWLVKLAQTAQWPHPWHQLNVLSFYFTEWWREREREREKSASSLKEILCNREQITVLPGRDWNGGGDVMLQTWPLPLLLFSAECWRKVRWGLI